MQRKNAGWEFCRTPIRGCDAKWKSCSRRIASREGILDRAAADLLNDSTVPMLDAGAQLGPYKLEASIGAGGMGEVWKARETRLNRIVAIKVSKEQFT